MPSFDPNGQSFEIADADTPLAHDATNKGERRLTLLWALNNAWASKDIGAIERWDEDTFHGWVMWPWKSPKG